MSDNACRSDDCDAVAIKRGMCNRHYLRWWKATPKADRPRPSLDQRFWSKVKKSGAGQCWEWSGYRRSSGHGMVNYDGRLKPAHVVALLLSGVVQPPGTEGCHRCDNPPCCNPKHLYFGTRQQNVDDAWARNRHPVGQDRPAARLTDQDVLAIRARYAAGEPGKDLAADFGISRPNLYSITAGQKWRHVGGPRTLRRSFKWQMM